MALGLVVALAAAPMTAAPARASELDGDTLRLLLGLAGAAAIGKLILDRQDRDGWRREGDADRHRGELPRIVYPDRHHRPGARHLLPGRCEAAIATPAGTGVLTETCLRSAGIRTANLPRACEIEARGRGGRQTVYSSRCLERAGYTIARGHGRPGRHYGTHRRQGGWRF